MVPAERGRGQKHFRHQPMVRKAGFVMHAVGKDLPIHFPEQFPDRECPSIARRLAFGQTESEVEEADDIRQVVVRASFRHCGCPDFP